MAEFSNKERGVRFTLPDRITVRDQLHYFSVMSDGVTLETMERYWEAAKVLIENWECKKLPNIETDLGSVFDDKITAVVLWSGAQVMNYMSGLGTVPKN